MNTSLWSPHIHQKHRAKLLQRNSITKAARAFFEARDFIEVETPILQISPGNETHLHAFATQIIHTDATSSALYLHTSPEFACKKLLSAGEERIFTLARVFRNRERGVSHSPEFTMLEWYRVGQDYMQLMEDCADFIRCAADALGTNVLRYKNKTCLAHAQPERISVCEAFLRFANIDLENYLNDLPAFASGARTIGVRLADDDTWSDIFSRILADKIEPNLGLGRAVILHDYPICEAALARPKPDNPKFAERFELYACGVELANAFGELTNSQEQRKRFEADMLEKYRIYGEVYPLDEDFLSSLTHMPQASGAALGFDRLVMLLTGANHIDDVIWAKF